MVCFTTFVGTKASPLIAISHSIILFVPNSEEVRACGSKVQKGDIYNFYSLRNTFKNEVKENELSDVPNTRGMEEKSQNLVTKPEKKSSLRTSRPR